MDYFQSVIRSLFVATCITRMQAIMTLNICTTISFLWPYMQLAIVMWACENENRHYDKKHQLNHFSHSSIHTHVKLAWTSFNPAFKPVCHTVIINCCHGNSHNRVCHKICPFPSTTKARRSLISALHALLTGFFEASSVGQIKLAPFSGTTPAGTLSCFVRK